MKKSNRFDDGFQDYLIENASFSKGVKIPELMTQNNIQIPKELIPFTKIKTTSNKRGYIHFYIHDKLFTNFIGNVKEYIPLLSQFDGVITPDCSMAIGQLDYLQKTNTYFNRAVGFYLQQNGIPIIPNVRWSDEESFKYCFNGIPKNSIISVSTHGCIKSNEQKRIFRLGLINMIKHIRPTDVIVYGYMPYTVFEGLDRYTTFHNYPNHFEKYCNKEV